MARLNKIAISLCALLFTSISLTPLAHASGHTHASATPKAHPAKGTTAERKKKAASSKSKTTAKTSSKKHRPPAAAKQPLHARPPAPPKNASCARATKSCAPARQGRLRKASWPRRACRKSAWCVKAIKPAANPLPTSRS